MVATIVNALAVIIGTLIGRVSGKRIGTQFRHTVFSGVGVASLLIGISMALQSQRILYMVLSLVIGGIIGAALGVEDRIYAFGEWLKARFHVDPDDTARVSAPAEGGDETSRHGFAEGFLVASVLFCVGALSIIGSFQAGVDGDYTLIFTKSVMDGFMAILLTTAYGIGVGFSAIAIIAYQGGLTLLAGVLAPFVNALMISEISGVGGAMVVMIGINLLDLRKIKTGDFLPALVIVIALVLADPFFQRLAF
ncbi:MAG: DUF554 domain-containing protein [Alkalispirochaeta sp.]